MPLNVFRLPRSARPAREAPPPVPPPWPPLDVTAPLLRRVVAWFAPDDPDTVRLAQETAMILLRASPCFLDATRANPTPTAWFAAVLDLLETLPEPLPASPMPADLPWRYLIFTRLAVDALEGAYGFLGQQQIATQCPLTPLPDPNPAPRRLAPQSVGPLKMPGLGALIVGACFSEDGQRSIYRAHAAGVPWSDTTAFWAQFQPLPSESPAPPTPVHTPPASSLDATPVQETCLRPVGSDAAVAVLETPPVIAGPSAQDPLGALTGTRESTPLPRRPRTRAERSRRAARQPYRNPPPGDLETRLCAAVRATLEKLVLSSAFNHQAGAVWFSGEAFWVVAQTFAQQLQSEASCDDRWAWPQRRTLYRRLARQGLVLLEGREPIWKWFVSDPGRQYPRLISALKLPASLYAEAHHVPVYQGRLFPASLP